MRDCRTGPCVSLSPNLSVHALLRFCHCKQSIPEQRDLDRTGPRAGAAYGPVPVLADDGARRERGSIGGFARVFSAHC